MRIRSIKYKSSTSNLLNPSPSSHSFYPRVQIVNSESSSKSNINLNHERFRQMLSQQCVNFDGEEGEENARDGSEVYRKGDFTGIMSEKIGNGKGVSMYQQQVSGFGEEGKENRTSIFQVKSKPALSKGMESFSTHQSKGPKVDRIRFRLSKFSQQSNEDPINSNNPRIPPTQPNSQQLPSKDSIILGQNLTNIATTLTDQLLQLQQQTRKEKTKLQKLRKDLSTLGPKIQKQLDHIKRDFRKSLQNLTGQMSRAKTEKCTILCNWKSVISEKVREYHQEGEAMQELEGEVERVRGIVEGNNGNENDGGKEHDDGKENLPLSSVLY